MDVALNNKTCFLLTVFKKINNFLFQLAWTFEQRDPVALICIFTGFDDPNGVISKAGFRQGLILFDQDEGLRHGPIVR